MKNYIWLPDVILTSSRHILGTAQEEKRKWEGWIRILIPQGFKLVYYTVIEMIMAELHFYLILLHFIFYNKIIN
jgi:hypothetical protein